MQKWDDFIHSMSFYRFNPHSLPIIRNVLCKMGRHDYEASSIKLLPDGKSWVLLECFYCLHKKKSRLPF